MTDTGDSAGYRLEGMALDGGWFVRERIDLSDSTGGHFSTAYLAESQAGTRGFVKVIDYARAFAQPEPAREIERMTAAFNFERDLLELCSSRRLSRIVVALKSGKAVVEGAPFGGVVEYLIFELADGDLRKFLDADHTFSVAWALRALHHIATGLMQLHRIGASHHDLKPSNVLVFRDRQGGTVITDTSKIADLGSASYGPHEPFYSGDIAYAPPETLYGYSVPDQNKRRIGCDAYLLGSMIAFLFARVGITALWLAKLREEHRWWSWRGDFHDALPYIRDAFGLALQDLAMHFPPPHREELARVVRQLCEPDPDLRGHPRAKTTSRLLMERYVSIFDRLAHRAEYDSRRGVS